MKRIILAIIYFSICIILFFQYITSEFRIAINTTQLKESFARVPDTDAEYLLTIYTDLPVKNNMKQFISLLEGYPGHSFIRLTKISGDRCCTKTFGLYPTIPIAALLFPGNSLGKFCDDTQHHYDYFQRINLTAHQFKSLLDYIHMKNTHLTYNLREYNCTDFALEIFNKIQPWRPLQLQKDSVLFNWLVMSTPAGLYQLLKSKQEEPGISKIQTKMPKKFNTSKQAASVRIPIARLISNH